VESETEQLSISLTPINPPIIIPAGGGSFQFTIDIDNLGIGATVFDAWTNVSVPGIAVPINLLQRSNILLPSGGNINRTLNQFVPGNAPAGTYTYRGFVGEYPNYIVDCDSFTFEKSATGNGYYSGTEWIIAGWDNENIIVNNIPSKISLLKSSPNPFNSKTKISFALPNGGMVSLVIYDITGKEIVKLSEGWKTTGSYEIDFDGSDMTSGIYFARLKAGDFSETMKMVLLK
jgi:hypothetical protein